MLSENGKVDPARLNALIFDQFQHGYYVSGEQVGKAWHEGAGLMKKCRLTAGNQKDGPEILFSVHLSFVDLFSENLRQRFQQPIRKVK